MHDEAVSADDSVNDTVMDDERCIETHSVVHMYTCAYIHAHTRDDACTCRVTGTALLTVSSDDIDAYALYDERLIDEPVVDASVMVVADMA